MSAFLLAFFLGSFGVHKFYLGNNGVGLVYLLLCWTGIPTILGLIDSILILLKSQSEFSGTVLASNTKKNIFPNKDKFY